MSFLSMDVLSEEDLKKRLEKLVDLDTWDDDCVSCSKPSLLHIGACVRSEKVPPGELVEIWKTFKDRVKPILKRMKDKKKRELENNVLLDGLQRFMVHMTEVNVDNMDKMCGALLRKEEGAKPSRVIKPAKVPTWTKELSLETFTKQIETWDAVNDDVPVNNKYQDFVESLKTNK